MRNVPQNNNRFFKTSRVLLTVVGLSESKWDCTCDYITRRAAQKVNMRKGKMPKR